MNCGTLTFDGGSKTYSSWHNTKLREAGFPINEHGIDKAGSAVLKKTISQKRPPQEILPIDIQSSVNSEDQKQLIQTQKEAFEEVMVVWDRKEKQLTQVFDDKLNQLTKKMDEQDEANKQRDESSVQIKNTLQKMMEMMIVDKHDQRQLQQQLVLQHQQAVQQIERAAVQQQQFLGFMQNQRWQPYQQPNGHQMPNMNHAPMQADMQQFSPHFMQETQQRQQHNLQDHSIHQYTDQSQQEFSAYLPATQEVTMEPIEKEQSIEATNQEQTNAQSTAANETEIAEPPQDDDQPRGTLDKAEISRIMHNYPELQKNKAPVKAAFQALPPKVQEDILWSVLVQNCAIQDSDRSEAMADIIWAQKKDKAPRSYGSMLLSLFLNQESLEEAMISSHFAVIQLEHHWGQLSKPDYVLANQQNLQKWIEMQDAVEAQTMLGETIYTMIQRIDPRLAGKSTGALLDRTLSEVLDHLADPAMLDDLIRQVGQTSKSETMQGNIEQADHEERTGSSKNRSPQKSKPSNQRRRSSSNSSSDHSQSKISEDDTLEEAAYESQYPVLAITPAKQSPSKKKGSKDRESTEITTPLHATPVGEKQDLQTNQALTVYSSPEKTVPMEAEGSANKRQLSPTKKSIKKNLFSRQIQDSPEKKQQKTEDQASGKARLTNES